jgi:hypothetical protein
VWPIPFAFIRTTIHKSLLSLRKILVRMHKDNINLPRLSPFSAGKLSQRGDRDSLGDQDIRTARPFRLRPCRAESIRG